ncbi:MAG: hypothetical protein ACO3JL_09815, partial [Myxococcota bacterium]
MAERVSSMKPRCEHAVVVLVALALCPLAGRAQGLDDAFIGAVVPHSSAAASDDIFATFANPAGLGHVDAMQGTVGYSTARGQFADQRAVGTLALQLIDGLTLGAGGGLWQTQTDGQGLRSWGLLSTGLALDRSFGLGASARYLGADGQVART